MIHKTTRSILSVLLAALLLVTSTPLTPAFAGGGEAVPPQSESAEGRVLDGDGKKDNPYQIATADDLLEFAQRVNGGETTAYAVLTANIDLSEICSEEEGDPGLRSATTRKTPTPAPLTAKTSKSAASISTTAPPIIEPLWLCRHWRHRAKPQRLGQRQRRRLCRRCCGAEPRQRRKLLQHRQRQGQR